MAEEWKESFEKFSNQWEQIYAAGWKAAMKSKGVTNVQNTRCYHVRECTLAKGLYCYNGKCGHYEGEKKWE